MISWVADPLDEIVVLDMAAHIKRPVKNLDIAKIVQNTPVATFPPRNFLSVGVRPVNADEAITQTIDSTEFKP